MQLQNNLTNLDCGLAKESTIIADGRSNMHAISIVGALGITRLHYCGIRGRRIETLCNKMRVCWSEWVRKSIYTWY